MPRPRLATSPRPPLWMQLRRTLASPLRAAALAGLTIALTACSDSLRPAEGPEIPSRQEVFEAARRESRAEPASVAALMAYRDQVCATIPIDSIPKKAQAVRGCFGPQPLQEIPLLEQLLASSRGTSDEPVLLERLIEDWGEVARQSLIECGRFALPRSPKVHDVELGLSNVRTLSENIERSRTEPERLCAELTSHFPNHKRRVYCPGDPPPQWSNATPDAEEAPSPSWPIPKPENSGEPGVQGI